MGKSRWPDHWVTRETFPYDSYFLPTRRFSITWTGNTNWTNDTRQFRLLKYTTTSTSGTWKACTEWPDLECQYQYGLARATLEITWKWTPATDLRALFRELFLSGSVVWPLVNQCDSGQHVWQLLDWLVCWIEKVALQEKYHWPQCDTWDDQIRWW